jgi:hypothetical protein
MEATSSDSAACGFDRLLCLGSMLDILIVKEVLPSG